MSQIRWIATVFHFTYLSYLKYTQCGYYLAKIHWINTYMVWNIEMWHPIRFNTSQVDHLWNYFKICPNNDTRTGTYNHLHHTHRRLHTQLMISIMITFYFHYSTWFAKKLLKKENCYVKITIFFYLYFDPLIPNTTIWTNTTQNS